MPRDRFELFPGRDVLQPDEVAVADKLYGRVGVRDVRLVLVPLLDPEVVVLVFVRVHSHLYTHTIIHSVNVKSLEVNYRR